MSPTSQMYAVLTVIAVIGVTSFVIRHRTGKSSSWPTWLLVPLAVWMALPLGAYSKPPDPIHPYCLGLLVLVLARWGIAVARQERNRKWIFYLFILIGGPFILGALGQYIFGQP